MDRSKLVQNWAGVILRPIARMCIRNSVKLQDILGILKKVLIDVAAEELTRSGESVSASRISAMTGVHRRDISQIADSNDQAESKNLIARIVSRWNHDPRFTTKKKAPRVLSAEGRDSEFAKLVQSENGGDLSGYAVLYEMERLGVVERTKKGVKLKWSAFLPEASFEEGLSMMARDASDLVSAVEENITNKPEVNNLHLRTEFDAIPASQAAEVKSWLLEEGSKFHHKVSQYLSKVDLDSSGNHRDSKEKRTKVALCSFSLVEKEGE